MRCSHRSSYGTPGLSRQARILTHLESRRHARDDAPIRRWRATFSDGARRVLLSAGVIDTFASGGLIGHATTVIIFGSASSGCSHAPSVALQDGRRYRGLRSGLRRELIACAGCRRDDEVFLRGGEETFHHEVVGGLRNGRQELPVVGERRLVPHDVEEGQAVVAG